MKKIGVLAVILATTFLLVGAANAEMYVEGYLGGTASAKMGQSFIVHDTGIRPPVLQEKDFYLNYPGTTDCVLGGVKLGTWFVKEGFAGWSGYPDWCKYFGFYTDFSYQRLEMPSQRLNGINYVSSISNFAPLTHTLIDNVAGTINSQGMAATWAFMFAGRYGFFPDSEVPFGRLQPYVAVGPAVMFTTLDPKLQTNGLSLSGGADTEAVIALAVDAGIRIMALKNVSFDISFKYRYAQPSFSYSGINGANGAPASFKLNPTYNLFSGQLGVAYHF
jgi:hypothetical protein